MRKAQWNKRGSVRLKPDAYPVDQGLVDKTGALIAVVGLARVWELALGIFMENGCNVDEAADIIDRAIKAWLAQFARQGPG